jgi:CHAT domain-containing protein/tetratricopeptide (TPR) repeat protein
VKKKAANRMDLLADWLMAQNRFREARFIIYTRIDLLKDPANDQAVLAKLLVKLSGKENLACEEANTRLDIARCIIKLKNGKITDEAGEHVQKSEELFKKVNHEYGLIDLMNMQIHETQESKRPEDMLSWILNAAEQYFARECYQQGIRCLLFSIPVTTDMGTIREKTQTIIERAQREISRVGGAALEQLLFAQTVVQTVIRAPEYGYARQCIEDYILRLPKEISPTMEGNLYTVLTMAYLNLGNLQKSQNWAEKALHTFRTGRSYINTSDAALHLASIHYSQGNDRSGDPGISIVRYSNAVNIGQGWAELDHHVEYYGGEVNKCLLVARCYSSMELWDLSDKWLNRAKDSADQNGVSLENGSDLLLLQAVRKNNHDDAVKLSLQFIEDKKAVPSTPNFVMGQEYMRAAMTTHRRFIHRCNVEGKQPDADSRAIFNDLMEATKLASQALTYYKFSGGTEMVVTAVNYLYDLVKKWPISENDDLVKGWLEEVQFAEELYDSIRRSSLSTDCIESLFEKRGVVSNKELQKLYANAVEACLRQGNGPQAWLWLQRGKARALSDYFGIRALIPERLLAEIGADPNTRALYDLERESNSAIIKASPQDYVAARRKAEETRVEMRKHPLLAQLLNIREGTFNVQFEKVELQSALEMTGRDPKTVKYIDWFIPGAEAKDTNIILFVRDLDGNTLTKTLSITTEFIGTWIKRVLEHPPEADPPLKRTGGNSKLRQLNLLIQYIEELTNEEDLLIICPSGLLTRIPIHAIRFRPSNRALIQRNPVLYSSSAATFRYCQMRAAAEGLKDNLLPENPTMLAVYDQDTEESRSEQEAIYAHGDYLRDSVGFNVLKGTAVTKSSLKYHCSQSRSIHYHGHAYFDKLDVLESSLVLSPESTTPATDPTASPSAPVPPAPLAPSHLTVADAFALDFSRTCPRITLIACDSGTQHIASGDEPLGFIPALLFAGATSVLGTLWVVESRAARAFSEEYYRQLEAQVKTQQAAGRRRVVLDLATAVRRTVIYLMEKWGPGDWAGYVLYGAWFHVMGS